MALPETLTLDKPEQLKALGHPLRVRALELLCQEDPVPLTNRELAQRLGVDPGHLHFHVRMLVRAGLIELADPKAKGREKPYRPVARSVRVHPDLLASTGAAGVQQALLEDVGRSLERFGSTGSFRTVQLSVRLDHERALELLNEALDRMQDEEHPGAEPVIVTAFVGPPAPVESPAGP